jgi:hypothetical protein
MIRDKLIPRLEEKYGGRGVRIGLPPDPIAVFPAKHPSVGELSISDDEYEATVYVGDITHGHFNSYDGALTQEEIDTEVTEEILAFLDDMFADKYLLWKCRDNGSGGWQHLDYRDKPSEPRQNTEYFVWSGPIEIGGAS